MPFLEVMVVGMGLEADEREIDQRLKRIWRQTIAHGIRQRAIS